MVGSGLINLEKYANVINTIVPIISGTFKYKGKKYNISFSESGWYEVEIKGNDCRKISQTVMIDYKEKLNTIRGYVFNEQFIFQNFDVGKRRTGREIMTDIYLNMCPSFSSIIAVIWEDGKLYYYQPNYRDSFIYTVKNIIESDGDIKGLKGLTPELRTLCLFYELEKQQLEELKAEQEAEKLRKTMHGRLILAFRRVGAELIQYSITGNRIIADWRIGRQEFNSVIDSETFRVLEAGYCMSGQDFKHNIHSLVLLAKDYDKDGLIYKTRE